MLTRAGLAVLDALAVGREATVDDLAASTEYSRAHLYDVLDDLLDAGLLTERRGANNRRRVRLVAHPVAEAYRALRSKVSHVEWPELLSPSTLRVCWYLDEPRRIATVAERLGVTRQAAYEAIAPFNGRAMLSPDGPEYALREGLAPLSSFARAVVRHEHLSRARSLAPSATVEWCDPRRALVTVQTAADTDALAGAPDWQVTGLARFTDYDLQFFLGDEPAFWYAPGDDGPDRSLTPAEVVAHTLCVDSGSRRVSYAMLLIEALELDRATLTETARWYGLDAAVAAMARWLDTASDPPESSPVPLPSETAFESLEAQYGLA